MEPVTNPRALTAQSPRLAYADLLKALAMLLVVLLHVSTNWTRQYPLESANWMISCVLNSISRCGVPLFVAVSGMFLLHPGTNLSSRRLLSRYIPRALAALLCWGVCYALLLDFAGNGLSWAGVLRSVEFVLRGNQHYHLWYLYMLIGLYLMTPFLRAFVRGAGQKDFHWILALCFCLTFLVPLALYFRPSKSVTRWVSSLQLNAPYYLFYYLLGYYLNAFPLSPAVRRVIYAIGAAGLLANTLGTCLLSLWGGALSVALRDNLSPPTAAITAALLVFFRYGIGERAEQGVKRRLAVLTKFGLGVYLVHPFWIYVFNWLGLFDPNSLSPLISIPLTTLAILLLSLAAVWPLSKLPVIRLLV